MRMRAAKRTQPPWTCRTVPQRHSLVVRLRGCFELPGRLFGFRRHADQSLTRIFMSLAHRRRQFLVVPELNMRGLRDQIDDLSKNGIVGCEAFDRWDTSRLRSGGHGFVVDEVLNQLKSVGLVLARRRYGIEIVAHRSDQILGIARTATDAREGKNGQVLTV